MKFYKYLLFCILLSISSNQLLGQYQPIPVDNNIIGTDLSMVKAILDNGGVYLVDNEPIDVFTAFKDSGYNYVRLRLFHTPNGQDGVVNSLTYTLALAQMVKDAGMNLLLDFHYSDTWADPSQQTIPSAWEGLDFSTLNDSIYNYTKKILNVFDAHNLMPNMIQTGNEINHGFLWPAGSAWIDNKPNYNNFSTLLKSAIRGVRESNSGSNVPVMLHAASGGSYEHSKNFMDSLLNYNVEFDILGLSYYHCWHGTLDDLEDNLSFLSSNYNHSIMIVETSYQNEGESSDYCVITPEQVPFPYTEQGQFDYLQAIYQKLDIHNNVKGLFYWGGDYIWAGDIGGSYSSLFHWQGNAKKALGAFSDFTTSVQNRFSNAGIEVFINSDKQLFVNTEDNVLKSKEINIYDISGKLVCRRSLIGQNNVIDLNFLLQGIYCVVINNEQNLTYHEKLVVY